MAWYLLHTKLKPTKLQHIIDEPLWLNSNLSRAVKKLAFIKCAFFIRDSLDEDGHFSKFEAIEEMSNMKETFLYYTHIIKIIPKEWEKNPSNNDTRAAMRCPIFGVTKYALAMEIKYYISKVNRTGTGKSIN